MGDRASGGSGGWTARTSTLPMITRTEGGEGGGCVERRPSTCSTQGTWLQEGSRAKGSGDCPPTRSPRRGRGSMEGRPPSVGAESSSGTSRRDGMRGTSTPDNSYPSRSYGGFPIPVPCRRTAPLDRTRSATRRAPAEVLASSCSGADSGAMRDEVGGSVGLVGNPWRLPSWRPLFSVPGKAGPASPWPDSTAGEIRLSAESSPRPCWLGTSGFCYCDFEGGILSIYSAPV